MSNGKGSGDLLDRRQRLAALKLLSAVDLPAEMAAWGLQLKQASRVLPGSLMTDMPATRRAGLEQARALIDDMLDELDVADAAAWKAGDDERERTLQGPIKIGDYLLRRPEDNRRWSLIKVVAARLPQREGADVVFDTDLINGAGAGGVWTGVGESDLRCDSVWSNADGENLGMVKAAPIEVVTDTSILTEGFDAPTAGFFRRSPEVVGAGSGLDDGPDPDKPSFGAVKARLLSDLAVMAECDVAKDGTMAFKAEASGLARAILMIFPDGQETRIRIDVRSITIGHTYNFGPLELSNA